MDSHNHADTDSLSLPAPSGEPGGLTVNYRLPTTTTLSWTPVPEEERNGVSTGYTVQVVGPDHSTVFERVVSADATSIDIPNLNPFTLYTFKVSTKTEAGSGPAASTSSESVINIRDHYCLAYPFTQTRVIHNIIIQHTQSLHGLATSIHWHICYKIQSKDLQEYNTFEVLLPVNNYPMHNINQYRSQCCIGC